MKAEIISDIHGNLEALQTVLQDIKKRRIKTTICLGDLVGYGANPNECVEICLANARVIIAGNHDWATIGKTDISVFNPVAAEAIRWTQKTLTKENFARLEELTLTENFNELFLVHSSPDRPEEWNYLFSLSEFEREFKFFNAQLCFVGHSHVPSAVFQDPNSYTDFLREDLFPIIKNRQYIINVGSVGQPRDLDPRASYVIYDGNKGAIEFVRLDYNVPLAQKKILDAHLPEILAQRLLLGQ